MYPDGEILYILGTFMLVHVPITYMVARPQVSDELVEFVQELHEDVTGSRAASFEQALRTFHRLHRGRHGSPAGEGLHELVARSGGDRWNPAAAHLHDRAVFKARLDDDARIPVPEAEVAALGLEPGRLLQVVAYPVGGEGSA